MFTPSFTPRVNTLYFLEEWSGKQKISPQRITSPQAQGTKFTPGGQLRPWGLKFAPRNEVKHWPQYGRTLRKMRNSAHQMLQELVERVVLVGQDEDRGGALGQQQRLHQLHPDESFSGAFPQKYNIIEQKRYKITRGPFITSSLAPSGELVSQG
jgi:hypothetical protein